jgi:drug/metabolite transporter (DMT)-like permease
MTAGQWMMLVGLSLLWGGSFFFVEVALTALPPLTVVWLRVALGAVVLALALKALRLPFPPRRAWGALAVMGFLNNAVPFSLFAFAQGQITGSLAAILNATTPILTVIVAHLATADERLSPAKAAGVAAGFAGVVVMLGGAAAGSVIAAKIMCLAAALSYALAGVWGRRFRAMGVAPATTALGQCTAAAVMLLPLWLWHDAPWRLAMPGANVLGAVLGIAILSTALAYLLYFRLLATAGATNLLLVTFLIPVSAALLGALVLGEALEARHVAGFGLIAAGLAAIDGRLVRAARSGSWR